tara:strand:- start:234 stop:551 length:318 start_codon:yes stop_codon:yes gene_type:complete
VQKIGDEFLLIYGLKNCDKCRAAKVSLGATGIVDLREIPLSLEKLQILFLKFGDKIINKKSKTWRTLSKEDRDLTSIELARKYPSVLKRPIIEKADGTLEIGLSS